MSLLLKTFLWWVNEVPQIKMNHSMKYLYLRCFLLWTSKAHLGPLFKIIKQQISTKNTCKTKTEKQKIANIFVSMFPLSILFYFLRFLYFFEGQHACTCTSDGRGRGQESQAAAHGTPAHNTLDHNLSQNHELVT